MRHLRVESEGHAPFLVRLEPGLVRLGRDADSEVVLGGTLVSRRHAELLVRDAVMELRDVGSMNGTLLRERRQQVRPGDEAAAWVKLWRHEGTPSSAIVSVGDLFQVASFEFTIVDVPAAPDAGLAPGSARRNASLVDETELGPPDSGVRFLKVDAVRAALRQRRIEAGLPPEDEGADGEGPNGEG